MALLQAENTSHGTNQPGEDTGQHVGSAFLERYRKIVADDAFKAVLLAAGSLNKQSVTLAPLEVDRSHWDPHMAAHMPLRARAPIETDKVRDCARQALCPFKPVLRIVWHVFTSQHKLANLLPQKHLPAWYPLHCSHMH